MEQHYFNPQQNNKTDYYENSDGKKVIDFFIGFVSTMLLGYFGIFALQGGFNSFVTRLIEIIFIIMVVLFIQSMRNRRYIWIGAVCSILIPLFLFGACFAIFAIGGAGF